MAATLGLQELKIRHFDGGLNLRDAQSELAGNESPDMSNVTLDERGGIAKRLGYVKDNSSPYNASLVQNLFYWASGQNKITQSGAAVFKDSSTVAFKTFTTSARVGFADFIGKLYMIHPIDGLFSYDGTTVAAIAAGPKGTCLAPWQNKLFASGDPANKPRVICSGRGDPLDWTIGGAGGANYNDLREKDSETVVCLSGAAGIDISGRPGLLAFKNESSYRIYDSATLAYQTIDPTIGAASALAVVNLFGRSIVLSQRGIFWTDGVSGLRPAGEKLEPLWDQAQIAYDKLDLFCAGARGDRVYFSLPRAGATANNLALEYHPLQGWITSNSNAMSCYSTYAKQTQRLLGGSPTVNGQTYELLRGGSDDGVAIHSYFQTPWFEPSAGILSRLRKLAIEGRGNFTLYTKKDYDTGVGSADPVTISRGGFTWNAPGSTWNAPGVKWGPSAYEAFADPPLLSLGTARAVSFRIDETSSIVTSGPALLGGAAPSVGAWGLYGLDLYFVTLGTA